MLRVRSSGSAAKCSTTGFMPNSSAASAAAAGLRHTRIAISHTSAVLSRCNVPFTMRAAKGSCTVTPALISQAKSDA